MLHLSILQLTYLTLLVLCVALALINAPRLLRPHKLTSKKFRQMLDHTHMSDVDFGIKWYSIPAANIEAHFKNNPMPTFDPLTGTEAETSIKKTRQKDKTNAA